MRIDRESKKQNKKKILACRTQNTNRFESKRVESNRIESKLELNTKRIMRINLLNNYGN